MRRFLLAPALLATALAVPAAATEPCYTWKTVLCTHTVTEYVTKCVPTTVCVTKYDHCGRAYHETVTVHKTVQVPVTKVVIVAKQVKVYH